MKILILGDIMGPAGREALKNYLGDLIKKEKQTCEENKHKF